MLRGTQESAQQSAEDDEYEEAVRAWARAILSDQTPVEGGFAPAPIFPARPTCETSLEPQHQKVSALLECH